MRGPQNPVFSILTLIITLVLAGGVAANELGVSVFDQELTRIRYSFDDQVNQSAYAFAATDEADLPLAVVAQTDAKAAYKSPGKAFLYSLVVPGLGQWYYGSRIKPVVFLAFEAAAWSQALKYHGNGSDLTVEYEQFNHDHWLRGRYHEYLEWNYNTTRPDTLGDPPGSDRPREITHILPDEESQQFYEMTGKYAQFAWGWDDAELGGFDWGDLNGQVDSIIGETTTPGSVNRETYETMRDDANKEFSKSMKFVFAIMANHLVSAFEAYFITKGHNNRMRYEQEFARLKVHPDLRSYYAFKDTPYVTVTYKF